jgi:hypothetical protein
MIDPYALIAGTATATMLLTGAGFAVAGRATRRADIAGTLAIMGLVIAAAVGAYAYGLRAHLYDVGTIAVVEIIEPAPETTVAKSQSRLGHKQ